MKDDYTTNSRYLAHTFSLKGWENVLFELRGAKGLRQILHLFWQWPMNGDETGLDEVGRCHVQVCYLCIWEEAIAFYKFPHFPRSPFLGITFYSRKIKLIASSHVRSNMKVLYRAGYTTSFPKLGVQLVGRRADGLLHLRLRLFRRVLRQLLCFLNVE